MSSRLRIPSATYRLQFNKSFRFWDAETLVTYLNRLGISDIYASPILKSRKGSSHGYDVIDPTCLNPELGTEHDFDTLIEELRQQGMGLLLDIVPNHMAAIPENPWWRCVLEHGSDSPFANFFDINWLDFKGSKGETTGYRRFFDIGELVGVRVEDPQAFEATHSYILQLIAEGKITGLRLDHIDGLYDPLEYLVRLQQQTTQQEKNGLGFYVLVEKILSGDEEIPETWPVFGTTGYDFARVLNILYINSEGTKSLKKYYRQATGMKKSFRDLVYEKKKLVMLELFPDEIKALGGYLAHLSGSLGSDEARHALVELTACLPVYRTYTHSMEVSANDLSYIEGAASGAAERKACHEALSFLQRVLLLDFPPDASRKQREEWLNFVMRWQQLTGAVMAKGFEDTALYNYNCLSSLNEVGGEPDSSGLSIEEFHKWNLKRARLWPHTLNATSTHDTKRSEDVRARINVLSEIPDEWETHLELWTQCNRAKKRLVNGQPIPEPQTEILLYQTIIGAWPLFVEEVPYYKERLKAYMIKAVREAKAITSWLKINQEYEDSLLSFIDTILEENSDNRFLKDFLKFQAKIAYYGALNSISQVLLKITSPGVPDFYQGTELWDFSLVDPDNRRPVDFNKRQRLLDSLTQKEAAGEALPIEEMLSSWQDGRVKLYATYKALNARRICQEVFQKGDYLPLKIAGERQDNICAFARRYRGEWVLIAAPRLFTQLSGASVLPIGKQVWQEDRILLPEDAPRKWLNVFTSEITGGDSREGTLPLAAIFSIFPVALLTPSV